MLEVSDVTDAFAPRCRSTTLGLCAKANVMDPKLIVGDQEYELTGRSVRTSGRTELRWSSNCPVCGTRFTVKTSEAFHHKSLHRRCMSCRRPGRFARKWPECASRAAEALS